MLFREELIKVIKMNNSLGLDPFDPHADNGPFFHLPEKSKIDKDKVELLARTLDKVVEQKRTDIDF